MKTNIWKTAATVIIGAALLATSCVEKENINPDFPEEQQMLFGEVGGTVDIKFTANLDWELSLSTNESIFHFKKNDGAKRKTISGIAGEQNVTVYLPEEISYDDDYVCDVTLTMGGQSKVIATITVPAESVMYMIYPAVWDENENTWKSNDGKYEYETKAVKNLTLRYDVEKEEFNCPAKVVSDLTWHIPAPETATWFNPLAETPANTNGVEVIFQAKNNSYPEESTTCELTVSREGAPADEAEVKIKVSIPNYKSVFIIEDIKGNTIYSESRQNLKTLRYVMASGMRTVAFEVLEDGSYDIMYGMESWLLPETDNYDNTMLTRGALELEIKENSQPNNRKGGFALLPDNENNDESIFTSDFKGIAEGIPYYMVEQLGTDPKLEGPVSSPKTSEELAEQKISFMNIFDRSDEIYKDFDCDYAYKLVKGKEMPSIVTLYLDSKDYTVEVCHIDYDDESDTYGEFVSVGDDWWVYADHEEVKPSEEDEEFNGSALHIMINPTYDPEGKFDGENIAWEEDHLHYKGVYVKILDTSGKLVAVIACEYDNHAVFGKAEFIEIDGTLPAGVTFSKKQVNSYTGSIDEVSNIFSSYSISEVFELKATVECSIPLTINGSQLAPMAEGKKIEWNDGNMIISDASEYDFAIYLLYDNNWKEAAGLVVIIDAPKVASGK